MNYDNVHLNCLPRSENLLESHLLTVSSQADFKDTCILQNSLRKKIIFS